MIRSGCARRRLIPRATLDAPCPSSTDRQFTGRNVCFQTAVVDGLNTLIGTAACKVVKKLATPLEITPDPVELDIHQGRQAGVTASIRNLVPTPVPFTASTNCEPIVSVNTGQTNPLAGVAPASGQAQLQIDVDARVATLGNHSCTLFITPNDRAVAPSLVPLSLEVVAPAVTVTIPPNAATPINLGGQVGVTVIGATGSPAAGFPTTFSIIPGSCDGTFITAGNPTQYVTVTSANGAAFASVQPTANCAGSLGVAITVTDPATAQVGGAHHRPGA
jgi:hypothetical protein